jgi:hypothetical protein
MVPARAEPPGPRPTAKDPARDRREIRFLGERLHATARSRTTTSSTSTTRDQLLRLRQACTVIICMHRLCTATPIEVTHNE